jgi:hypothetical protein
MEETSHAVVAVVGIWPWVVSFGRRLIGEKFDIVRILRQVRQWKYVFAEITRRIQKNSTHPNHHLALFNGAFSSRTKLALNSLPPFGARSPHAG